MEARESDPHSAVVASSPAARCLLAPRREHSNFLTSASASCQLCGLAPLHVPRLIVAVSVCSSFPDALMGNVSTSRCGSVRAFRSYDSGSDASAVGRLVTTHRVTWRTAVYQHSSLIKEEEVRRVLLSSECFHFHNDKENEPSLLSHTGLHHHYCFLHFFCLFFSQL